MCWCSYSGGSEDTLALVIVQVRSFILGVCVSVQEFVLKCLGIWLRTDNST